ncbi:SRPBCC domain-containing protein [Salinimicrobium soli]|uniref:SRPBCC domain-containing protein n=1 Tax=Salinimicrobium soli TaxID=1254399 RepID=UPI003AAF92E4
MDELEIKTGIQISRAPKEVFEAIVDPEKMSNYFIAESTGRMEEGKDLEWKFPEFDEKVKVHVVEVKPNEYISFKWEGAKGEDLLVEMTLLPMPEESTLVKITEGKMANDKKGLKWLAQNTEGWANFLACLKAFVEHEINLRKGAFDFMKQ